MEWSLSKGNTHKYFLLATTKNLLTLLNSLLEHILFHIQKKSFAIIWLETASNIVWVENLFFLLLHSYCDGNRHSMECLGKKEKKLRTKFCLHFYVRYGIWPIQLAQWRCFNICFSCWINIILFLFFCHFWTVC